MQAYFDIQGLSGKPFWAFLQKLTQYGKLMEAYVDIQYGHNGKLGGFFYDFIPYVNHMEAQFSYFLRS